MYLIPAIDLKDGQCVRLRQGALNDATVFSDSPSKMALQWLEQGASRLHLVDLNGAFAGQPKNLSAIKSIVKEIDGEIPIQIGGGIRSMEIIEQYLDIGMEYVIIGTAAVKDPQFLEDACAAFAGHIIVGLDAKDGQVATDGWSKVTRHSAVELAKKYKNLGIESIIYTDIGRDGMMTGVNIEATVQLAQSADIPVIASGGVSNLEDIRKLCEVRDQGVEGVILGRSIYEGSLNLQEALDLVDEYTQND